MNSNEGQRPPKTVHIFLGYFFIVNYCLGTGFLGIPYLFFYSGYLAAIPTLTLIAFLTWLTSQWLLEVMARAQAIEYYKQSKESDNSQSNSRQHPIFEITLNRKFETSELSEMFVGRWLKFIYLALVVVYGFFGCWSFSAVAGSAWATNIPYSFGAMEICESDAFLHQTLPSESGCLYSYYFGLFFFGLIVVTLSVMDLREQVVVHVFFGVLRYFTIAVIVIYCIAKLAIGGNVCAEAYPELPLNGTIGGATGVPGVSYGEIVLHFDPKAWMISIPVFVYAFMIHSGVSSLTHPIKQKKYLHWMMVTNFAIAEICLLTLGIVVPLWFKESVQETITLNWAVFTRRGNPPWLQVLSYYLVLFVSLDVISAYPLTIHAMVNNIYIIITGHDTSEHPKWKLDRLLRFLLRLVVATVPLAAAFGVSNLIFVLKYAGLLGFGVCFLYPTILQLASTYVCVREFGNKAKPNAKSSAAGRGGRPGESSELEQRNRNDMTEISEEAKLGHGKEEKSPLLSEKQDTDSKLYMTPYSNAVLSHPIFVGTVAIVEACLSVLAFASVFVVPNVLACDIRET